VPKVPDGFHQRGESDRYEQGTRATLIKNATIWTGAENGTEVVRGDVLLERGVVRGVGSVPASMIASASAMCNLTVVDANGAWVTPGLGGCPLFLSLSLGMALILGSGPALPSRGVQFSVIKG
jgi:hypothetical protein